MKQYSSCVKLFSDVAWITQYFTVNTDIIFQCQYSKSVVDIEMVVGNSYLTYRNNFLTMISLCTEFRCNSEQNAQLNCWSIISWYATLLCSVNKHFMECRDFGFAYNIHITVHSLDISIFRLSTVQISVSFVTITVVEIFTCQGCC